MIEKKQQLLYMYKYLEKYTLEGDSLVATYIITAVFFQSSLLKISIDLFNLLTKIFFFYKLIVL